MGRRLAQLEFDRAFTHYGGGLDLALVEPPLRQLLADWRELFQSMLAIPVKQDFPAGPIYLDYVDNSRINAIATASRGHELIGFFVGASGFVLHCFAALALVPQAFDGTGEVAVPLHFTEAAHAIRTPTTRYLDFAGKCDPTRVALAQAATTVVHFFLFAHEVGHIIFGHLLYIHKSGLNAMIVEDPGHHSQGNRVTLYERQLLELDADMHGAVVSLNWWMRIQSHWHEVAGVDAPLSVDPFYLWAFTLGALFRFFDLFRRDPVQPATHPPGDVRFLNAYVRALQEVRTRVPDSEPQFTAEVGRAMRDLTRLWAELGLNAPSFSESRGPGTADALRLYLDRWESLKDESLDPLAFQRAAALRAGGEISEPSQ